MPAAAISSIHMIALLDIDSHALQVVSPSSGTLLYFKPSAVLQELPCMVCRS